MNVFFMKIKSPRLGLDAKRVGWIFELRVGVDKINPFFGS